VSSPVNAAYVREQYELLRREATTADPMGPRGHGLVLLMTRGISAWLETVQTLTPRANAPAEHTASMTGADGPTWKAGDRAELTRVLASLVLTCVQEVAAP
jgi:hypothetical protein